MIRKLLCPVHPTDLRLEDFRPISLDEEWDELREIIYITEEYDSDDAEEVDD